MIVVIDVYYHENTAKCVAGLFQDWNSEKFYKIYDLFINDITEYIPGQFYKRELPCILKILENIQEEYECIVIDGYVFLGAEKKTGLGKHLWDNLSTKKPIIGVAKNYFKDTPEDSVIFRGQSQKPLYITSIDIPLNIAKESIIKMYGDHRIPDLIKKIDLETRL